ncbi:MAG: neuraminidase [Bacteroidales bacterium]|nr:neuraminidase [Bacteroidales bacterium]
MRTKKIATLITTLCIIAGCSSTLHSHLIPVGEGYSKTSVNATIFRNSSIVTHNNFQYIAYYDGDGYLTLGKRKIGAKVWVLKKTQYKGNVSDAHNIISMTVDGEGYIHVAFDHHGHPLNYAVSTAPESLTLGDKRSMIGKDEINVTYPEFYTLKGGDLLFAYRDGASGRGNLVLNQYDLHSKTWSRIQDILIDGENQRNAYWQMCVDAMGTIHISWVWRESWLVETNHDLCYARSYDNGKTWEKSNGEKYSLPINANNAEYALRIPQHSELINQTSMSCDEKGNPYIATYWRDSSSNTPQYRVVWHNGTAWNTRQISQRSTPFSLSGGGTKMIPIARPRIAIKGKEGYFIFRDEERNSKVSIAYTKNIDKGEWIVGDYTDFPVYAWEPSLDTELWNSDGKLHIFVQSVKQGDGERTIEQAPEMVYILEVEN